MKYILNKTHLIRYAKNSIIFKKFFCIFFFIFSFSSQVLANDFKILKDNQERVISGTVLDDTGITLPGVSISIKGTSKGTQTDFDGKFSIAVPNEKVILVFSYLGMKTRELPVKGKLTLTVVLNYEAESLDEIVVVGYGQKKKASIVGAIVTTKGEELLEAGGVTNVAEALEGRLPGVSTIQSSGQPGANSTQIFIRGQASWNGSGSPLILVDGVQRTINDIDFEEIEQVSVLKDASATAVFGVQGANGVILITTKRGKEGGAKLSVSANTTIKVVSKLPQLVDSYNSTFHVNEAIMREIMYSPNSWNDIIPLGIADKYRNPASVEESYIYPNTDWAGLLLKDFAQDYRVNLNVRGGNSFVKYFGSLSVQTTRDILKGADYDNGRGYSTGYKYDRYNYRSNLDFDLTKTTKFSVNLGGFVGFQESPSASNARIIGGLYSFAPSLYTPLYPDGYFGWVPTQDDTFANPLTSLISSGSSTQRRIQVNTDFILKQKLNFITKGLSFTGRLSLDNRFSSTRRLSDPVSNIIFRTYDLNGNESIISEPGVNDFDFVPRPWTLGSNNINDGSRFRRLNYRLSLNYKRTFGDKHDVSALLLFMRDQSASGSVFPRFREDWVTRVTYDYDSKYLLDISGAYNGSEKFGPGNRFDLFPSIAVGWVPTKEKFMENINWIDRFKFRFSYGLIGDDNSSGRWRYLSQWKNGGRASLDSNTFGGNSDYIWYRQTIVGNPDLRWETAIKSNFGINASFLKGAITTEFDYFNENRKDIVITGNQRSVPDWFGALPPDVNSGEVEVKGYELVLGLNHTFDNNLNLWSKIAFSSAKDKIIYREDPELRPEHLQLAGYQIGQTRAAIPGQILQSWDDIYGATPLSVGQDSRRPGYYDIVDFNSDGSYNEDRDDAPYGYPTRPQQSWSLRSGARYKGLSFTVMFTGNRNSTKQFITRTFQKNTYLIYDHALDYWTKDNPNSTRTLRYWSEREGENDPLRDYYDASIVRLKTVELAYKVPKKLCTKIGFNSLRVFVNGNNLHLWTNLPDDREFNGTGTSDSNFRGDYPTIRRFNLGFNLNF